MKSPAQGHTDKCGRVKIQMQTYLLPSHHMLLCLQQALLYYLQVSIACACLPAVPWLQDGRDWAINILPYFRTIRCNPPQQIWEENGVASYSPNIAYLACFGGAAVERGFFSYFPPLKPRYVLWSGASYSPKNTVILHGRPAEVKERRDSPPPPHPP